MIHMRLLIQEIQIDDWFNRIDPSLNTNLVKLDKAWEKHQRDRISREHRKETSHLNIHTWNDRFTVVTCHSNARVMYIRGQKSLVSRFHRARFSIKNQQIFPRFFLCEPWLWFFDAAQFAKSRPLFYSWIILLDPVGSSYCVNRFALSIKLSI